MSEKLIVTASALTDFCAQIANAPWIAVDTEFMREKTYYPKLCLIQISDGVHTAAIDPLTLTDLSPLREIMFNPNITKVFHAARQDLEIFLNIWQALPAPLFDTQPAAALLGHGEQIGYAKLVDIFLNIQLAKGHSRTDWNKRPLSEGQLRYALDDVIYLGQAYTEILSILEKKQRLHWLDEEFQVLNNPKTYIIDATDLWTKVKGKQHLSGVKLAILQQLANWREQQAIKKNLPRRWVLKDEVMIDLARRTPADTQTLSSIRGLEPRQIGHIGEQLIDLIEKGKNLPKADWPKQQKIAAKLTPQQEALCDYLQCALQLIATENQTIASAIASKKDLAKLIQGTTSPLNSGWRYGIAGKILQDIAQGESTIQNNEGVLSIATTA